jgi:RND superfamily putative drug exporter
MATVLYRLGRFAYRSRRVVGLVWLAVVLATGVGAATLSGPTSDTFAIPGTESQQAFDLLAERFPDATLDGASARVVFATTDGSSFAEPDSEEIVTDVLAMIESGPHIAGVVSPYESGLISEDGTIALAQVAYAVDFFELSTDDSGAQDLLYEAAETGRAAGLTVELGGDALEEEEELGSELIGLGIAAAVLIITFGSLAAAGMPLITGITGVGIGLAAITAATGFMEIGSTAPILAIMLGLAVGIDYALFIVSRYRHELMVGRDGEEAAGRAIGTAGSAVVFAGLTVIVALVGLTVVDVPILTEMGLAAALTVGLAVLIALTLLPALFGFAGQRVLTWRVPGLTARDSEADTADDSVEGPTLSRRWVGLISRRPVAVLTAALAGMAIVAIPVADLRLGLPDDGDLAETTTQRQAYDLTAKAFGPGFNGPLMVVVDAVDTADPHAAAEQVVGALNNTDGVALAAPPEFNTAGDTATITVMPTTGPASEQTEDLVERIRSDIAALGSEIGTDVVVTGTTAVFIDFTAKMGDALLPYLSIVVGLSFALLMLVFRSIVVPLKAALGFLLTITATFGALVAVYQWGWLTGPLGLETGPIFSILPIFIIGVVFGLAMDYQVFLVTRMREEYVHGSGATTAVTVGFQHGSRVVAAAAIIMISVFGGFVLGDSDDVAQVGLALAVAIAFDAFVVRMTIVPAVLVLVGDRAWWLPRWLDRILPNVDVEGEKLARYLAERERQSRHDYVAR